MDAPTLTVGSLFSGVGGLDLGLERAGMRVAWQVEIDDYATRVLARHWPNVPRFRDVRECGRHNLAPVDLVAGGFPCQPHSLAGKRGASGDDRDLWGEFARILRELKPRWVVAENVPGLLSSEAGRFFGRVLRDLAASGYDAEWDCLPAAAFGAPHLRDRVFLVAHARGKQLSQQSQPQSEGSAAADTGGAGVLRPVANGHSRGGTRSALKPQVQAAVSVRPDLVGCGGSHFGAAWQAEPNVDRMADGFPGRVDRIRGLGNAVVPQVAEYVGRRILAAEGER